MVALPPAKRQYVVWLHLRPGEPGLQESSNNGLIVVYCGDCARVGQIAPDRLAGHYVLTSHGKVWLDSNLIYGGPGMNNLIPVMTTFRSHFLRN
jgi:hypothetical protein